MSAEAEKARFVALLDRAADEGRPVPFWWRDDDAVAVTPALETLAGIQQRHHVPLALAVIPDPAEKALADFVADNPGIVVFQHGFRHKNHADKSRGWRASEFHFTRPVEDSLADLRAGFARMTDLFGDRFLPVLTPPWNRIGAAVRKRRGEAGLIGLSTFSRIKFEDRHLVNCHVDIIRWRGENRFAGREKCYRRLAAQMRRRLDGLETPIGLLTHHLVHDDAANAFMDEVVGLLANHPGASWPDISLLFDLPGKTPAPGVKARPS